MSHPPVDSQITFLYTNDLARTAHFYQNVLGLKLKLDQGTCRIYQISKDGYLGFCQKTGTALPASDPAEVIVTLVVPNLDEWHQHLQEQNLQVEKPPALNAEYDIYHCLIRDPNGYVLEIQQFLHPF